MPPINDAIRAACEAARLTQADLARRMGRASAQAVNPWFGKAEPSLEHIGEIEAALELPRGYLLRAAGYVNEIVDIEDAIANDAALQPTDRTLLIQTYRFATSLNERDRPPKAPTKRRRS